VLSISSGETKKEEKNNKAEHPFYARKEREIGPLNGKLIDS
jgi:hypothetical protein